MSEWQKTGCVLCLQSCGMEVMVRDNRIVKVRPDKDNLRSQGYTCRKGLKIAHLVTGNPRLKQLYDDWVERLGLRDPQRNQANIMGRPQQTSSETTICRYVIFLNIVLSLLLRTAAGAGHAAFTPPWPNARSVPDEGSGDLLAQCALGCQPLAPTGRHSSLPSNSVNHILS